MADEIYIPAEDITEEGADGVSRLVAAKGVPIPMDEARRRGLVKDQQAAGPQETKDAAPAEKKAK